MTEREMSAVDLQHLSDAARSAFNISGTGIEVHRTLGSGTHIRVPPQRRRGFVPSSSVFVCAVTVKPLDTDTTLTIREVRYKDGNKGPIVDTERPYEFDGDPITDALPFPGRKAKDYADAAIVAGESGAIELAPGDTFFEAFKVGDLTIVGDLPGEGGAATARFKIVGLGLDTVVADRLTVDEDGVDVVDEVAVSIARPWYLRRTPFDGKSHKGSSYVYIDEVTRNRKFSTPAFTEREIILPTYGVGDIINGVKVGDVVTAIAGVDWKDDNDTGRTWARSFAQ